MFEHYQTHKKKNNHISFLDFLNIHYTNTGRHGGDDDQDRELPFKSHSACSTANSLVYTGTVPQPYRIQPFVINVGKLFYPPLQFIPSSFEANIWQPPKSC